MTTDQTRIPVNGDSRVSMPRMAVSAMLTQAAQEGRMEGISMVCEALDELLPTDEPGDTLALLAPWLAANGYSEAEIAR